MLKTIFLSFILFTGSVFSQELQATVVVNYEQLSNKAKDRIQNFKYQVEDYLNNTKFTEKVWEYDKIKCNFNIFFVSGTDEMSYKAQVVVNSQRPVFNSDKNSLMFNVLDNSWDFKYETNQQMYYNPSIFDPLTSFLDFYAYLIIGFDMDSFGPEPLGGSQMFSNAEATALRGSSSAYSDAWQFKSSSYNRRALLNDLLDASYQQFREDFMNYHFNGLDLFAENKKLAFDNMTKIIYHLHEKIDKLNPRSVLLKIFFDSKAGEFVEFLKDHPKKAEIFNMLIKINASNISKYEKALE